jgi:hypothetical protein
MFSRSRPASFNLYGRRRSRWHLPRWLWLILFGTAAGAVGVVVVQERYLAPRLSAGASAALRGDFERADAQRQRLALQLDEATKRLDGARGEQKALAEALAGSRAAAGQLRDDVEAVVAALPPDPKGGDVEVRAARFAAKDGALGYDLVLTRERATGKPVAAVLQLVVAGASARGIETAVSLKPVALSIGRHQIVRGSQPLPDGFRAQQATIQVLDRPGGRALGKRVMLIR